MNIRAFLYIILACCLGAWAINVWQVDPIDPMDALIADMVEEIIAQSPPTPTMYALTYKSVGGESRILQGMIQLEVGESQVVWFSEPQKLLGLSFYMEAVNEGTRGGETE